MSATDAQPNHITFVSICLCYAIDANENVLVAGVFFLPGIQMLCGDYMQTLTFLSWPNLSLAETLPGYQCRCQNTMATENGAAALCTQEMHM